MKLKETMKDWSLMQIAFTLCGLPMTLPWLLYYIYDVIRRRKNKSNLSGKVVLITGASSGVGEALAHVFYNCGCKIILVARRQNELERVKNDLMQTKQTSPTYTPIVLPLDLTEINLLPSKMEKIMLEHGKIDILINNAGVSYRGDAATTKIDVDMKVMLINYFSQIALAKAILPEMIERKSGRIICISSVQGKIAIPYRSAYAASKHALQAWCDSARAELANSNIKITVVNPGYIKTDLSVNALTDNGEKYGIIDKNTEQGYSPKHVADEILYAVLRDNKEQTIATFLPKAAAFLRYMIPTLYFIIMNIRARKSIKKE